MLNSRGFTVIEVLVALMVFMIGAVGISALITSSVRSTAFSGDLTEATLLASNKLEDLRLKDYDHADLDDVTGDGAAGLDDLAAAADGVNYSQGKNSKFTVQWNVANNIPATDIKTIKVIVTWTYKLDTRSISLSGLRTE